MRGAVFLRHVGQVTDPSDRERVVGQPRLHQRVVIGIARHRGHALGLFENRMLDRRHAVVQQ